MRVLLEAGTDPNSPDISCELPGPCFEASALRTEVSESIHCLQLQFEYQASGPLVQQDSPTRTVLDVTHSFDVVFSSEWSSDRFTGKPVSATTGLYYYGARYGLSIGRLISQGPYPGHLSDPRSLNPVSTSGTSQPNYGPYGRMGERGIPGGGGC